VTARDIVGLVQTLVLLAGVQWSRVYCCAAFEDHTVQTTRATWDDLTVEDLG